MSRICVLTLLFAAGCTVGLRLSPSINDTTAAALIAAPALLLAALWLRPGGRSALHATALFVVIGAAAGALRGAALEGGCTAGFRDGAALRLHGSAATLPDRDGVIRIAARRRVAAGTAPQRCVVELRARAHGDLTARLEPAQDVEFHGRWRASPRRGGWPRPESWRGTFLVDSVRVLPAGSVVPAGTRVRQRLMTRAQHTLRGTLGERAGMAEALVLARRDGLEPGVRERFVAAGLAHLLAISGLHIGIVATGVLGLAVRGGVPARGARLLALGLTATYVLFLGAPQPASRAVLQFGLLAAGLMLQRPADRWALLATAALLLLVRDPLSVLDAGVQLSFAGIGGLLAFREPLLEWLPARWPRGLRDAVAASIAASATTSPIAAVHFGQFAPIGVASSVVATPLVAALLPVLAAVLLLGVAAPGLAAVPAFAADVMLALLDHGVRATAALPGGGTALSWSVWLAGMGAALAFVLTRAALRGRRAGRQAQRAADGRLAFAVAAAVLFVLPPAADRGGDRGIQIHTVDVGQGDAIAIRTPRGRWILVDAGPRSLDFDAGARILVPYLLRQGARRVEALILTHPHADHIGGARAVIETLPVGMILDPGVPEPSATYVATLAAAHEAGVPWFAGREGTVLRIDGVEIEVLHPVDPLLDATGDANDISVVLRLAYGSFSALLLGDAPEAVENALVRARGAAIDVDLLKVAHHGSRFSTGDSILAAASPVLGVIGVGRRNRYGHPAPEVLARLAGSGTTVLRTDEHGSIVVRVAPGGRIRAAAHR